MPSTNTWEDDMNANYQRPPITPAGDKGTYCGYMMQCEGDETLTCATVDDALTTIATLKAALRKMEKLLGHELHITCEYCEITGCCDLCHVEYTRKEAKGVGCYV